MRITNNMMVSSYQRNLTQSLNQLNKYSSTATSSRRFDKVSDNPVLASQAYKLRREYSQNADYQSNLNTVSSTFSTAENAMMSINTAFEEALQGDCVQAITGTSGADERAIIATKLRNVQDAILDTLNTKYADQYVFAGSGSSEAPFSLSDDGDLLYRGANVTTGVLENEDGAITTVGDLKVSFGEDNGEAFNGYTLSVVTDSGGAVGTASVDTDAKTITVTLAEGATAQDLQDVLQDSSAYTITGGETLSADFSLITVDGDLTQIVGAGTSSAITNKADLSALANEQIFMDIGLGLKFNSDGSVNAQSALNVSITGLSFMGYGTNEDGVPNNIYTLLGDIADQLESDDYSLDNVQPYIDNLNDQESTILSSITALGVRSNYIEKAQTRLSDQEYYLDEKIDDVEYMDPTEAIMNYKMQEYSYRAALQMGSNILQASLLDYLD